ncbi:cupin domain-containing protein [Luteimonas sp. MC1750]|uniref:cupin domain-containing protein n=1 Tax=Luteimonas sp. MC1750 TaxID=2799326 RepID=UPI0018F09A97|nr:cupin domain-containing protein [Luteimonas sp. MC1750]MBJ6984564.1 cupin domain-containing protein [Luteimonas sp. MC1750]QQO04828.1 cupin domain-containing protein [Luteimonas sp. MC1750]
MAKRPSSLPFEVQARAGQPLGMAPRAFLRDYWHKRPLLVRGAFPGYVSPVEPEDLAGLACEEGVLARLIQHDRARDAWTVRSGPFPEELFPGLGDRDWTLLVQDMDKWDPDIAALLPAFNFLPRWRVDDVMVSFAATGGSVGAHVDHYDVFLLQAMGHRRWQIDASDAMGRGTPALDFRDDAEIKLLRDFSPTHDWVLEPGDMLYLPPLVPHHGVAEDPCLTFSLGMRAPSVAELMGDYVDTLAAEADEALRYADPALEAAKDPWEIDAAAMARVVEALNAVRMADADALGDWFGRFITVYRAAAGPGTGPGADRAEGGVPDPGQLGQALDDGLVLARYPWTRVAWRRAAKGASLYVAGQSWRLPVADARRLAATELLDAAAWTSLSAAGRDCVAGLMAEGHYRLEDTDTRDPDDRGD